LANITPENELPGKSLLSSELRKASFSALHERDGEAAFMWRTNNYKLILVLKRKEKAGDYVSGDIITGEFYNLKEDPKEWYDLFNQEQTISIQKKYTHDLLKHLHIIPTDF